MKWDCLRGEIYYIDFGEGIGSEQKGTRPALVVQNNIGNKFSTTTIVAAITTKEKNREKHIPTHYALGGICGLKKRSVVLLEQIRTVEKNRITGYIGKLTDNQMKEIDNLIHISFGLNCNKGVE